MKVGRVYKGLTDQTKCNCGSDRVLIEGFGCDGCCDAWFNTKCAKCGQQYEMPHDSRMYELIPEFHKFPSIEQSSRQKIVNQAKIRAGAVEWVAREKIHGANFQIRFEDGRVFNGSRNEYIEDLDKFYDCREVVERYNEHVKSAGSLVAAWGRPVNFTVYCELAGTMKNGKKMQSGIEYGDQDLFLLAVYADGKGWLSDDELDLMSCHLKMRRPPLLKRGTLDEICALSPDFESQVLQKRYKNDIAEGFVAMPVRPVLDHNGSRIAIKFISKHYQETHKIKVKVPKAPVELVQGDLDAIDSISEYLTQNRLDHILSHQQKPTASDFGRIQGEFVKDALDDWAKDNDRQFVDALDNRKAVMRQIAVIASAVIRERWIDIIE